MLWILHWMSSGLRGKREERYVRSGCLNTALNAGMAALLLLVSVVVVFVMALIIRHL